MTEEAGAGGKGEEELAEASEEEDWEVDEVEEAAAVSVDVEEEAADASPEADEAGVGVDSDMARLHRRALKNGQFRPCYHDEQGEGVHWQGCCRRALGASLLLLLAVAIGSSSLDQWSAAAVVG